MGTKRPHRDSSMPPAPSSQHNTKPPFKRRKPNDFAPLSASAKSPSINQLKSKIRDLTRLLSHSDHLPAGVRIEKERALAGYKQDVDEIHTSKRRNDLIKKYHMVRFFERQKATRAHKRLKKRFEACTPDTLESSQLEKDLHDSEIDLNYTIYHPLTEKYKSIFPRGEMNAAGAGAGGKELATRRRTRDEKSAMWLVVERCTAEGTLEALREGKVDGIPGGERTAKTEESGKREGRNGRVRFESAKRVESKGQDGDSDGGFFEE